ncbi:hypothetical protein D187_000851 [Cystobacter fuscus DSM 2262]|uniref:Uncharacterized protein n=1 Tax=Cystobacter fuscus (strain ATCC 25194 / DSM 2262 / NBRC 100088 / M29) TaxID=1242864 RepID=S9PMB8_CYSF2|nr:hypothetical protein [Cystobacter fuscus]EPX65425.1 hypothetical protein D187_000851 [Cystobacter fuscus DSM 2262]
MGWLKSQMEALEPRATSYSALARRLKQGNPSLRALTRESLATYLGQLDKGDASALLKHPKAWEALAELLGLSSEELDARLDPAASGERPRTATRLELWDVDARPLELREEPLPPGIPSEVQDPRGWPCWWSAPGGSGRTLVGRWLEARGLATFIQARTWSEAREKLPQRGAIFVELTGAGREDVPPTPPSRSLCIAANWRPPDPPTDATGEPTSEPWPLVECAPVESWLEALVAWLEPRLDQEDGFDREVCLRWLRDDPWASSALDGFGSVLGLVGLFVKHGTRGTRDAAPERLIRGFLQLRLDRLASAGKVLRRDALDKGLQRLARGLLLDGEHPPWESRPLVHWYALARGEGPDARWLHEAGLLGLERAAVQRASQRLPPDGFEVVQSLRTLHLLRETRSAELALRPPWLLETSLQESATRMAREEPAEVWGAALLLPPSADYVVEGLFEHFRTSRFEPLSRLLQALAPAAPEWVAAVEGAFLALGLAVLEGARAPADLGRELYEWQRRLMLQGPEVPEVGRELPRRRILGGTHLLAEGMWYLAALALSESLGKDVPPLHSGLDPWVGAPAVKTQLVQEEAWTALLKPAMARGRAAALDLGGRLFERGERGNPISWLQFPAFLLQGFQRDSLSWFPKAPWKVLMPELPSYLERHGESWLAFAEALWRAWLASSNGFPSAFAPSHPWAESLWKVLPPEVVADERFQDMLSDPRVPYEHFGPEHWRAFLTLWPKRNQDFMSAELRRMHAWHHIPREHALAAILQGLDDSHVREVLLRRFPELALEALRAYLARADWMTARGFVQGAPAEHAVAMLDTLVEEVLRREASMPGWLGEFLRELVMARGASWRKAWEWFARLVPVEGGEGPGRLPS